MSRPPEHIKLKRLRDNEPVDLLYIKQSKRQFTDVDCVFRRLQDDGNPSQLAALSRQSQIPDQQTQPAITGYPMPQVPTVRATEADEESTNERASVVPPHTRPNNLQNYMLNEESLALSSQRKINPRSQKCPDSAGHSVKPRSFRLVKSPSCKSLRHSTLSGGIQKFKSRRSDLAVFVEKAKDMFQPSNLHNLASVVSSERCQEIMKNELSIKNGPKPSQRKRPNATTEERRWRLENWSKEIKKSVAPDTIARQMVKNPLLRWDQDSMPLARQLHEIAIQEIETTGKSVGPGKSDIQPKPQLKHPLLQSQNDQVHQPDSTPEEIMKTSSQDDDEMDYVYDTYVRHDIDAAKPTSEVLEPYAHLTEAVVSTKIGVLMILEEDQELWEAYGEEPESDKDWNSEEEDENAEDFHGNDYPEDEVDSDDEYDRGAYKYRKGASDDEEYDEDMDLSGADDEGMRHPWQRNVWNISKGDNQDSSSDEAF